MTQQKSKKTAFKPQNQLQTKYFALSPNEQMGVTTFLNCHNAAHYVYDNLSEEAKDYVNYCIRMSQKADEIEKKESAQVS